MKWLNLVDENQLSEIIQKSNTTAQIIFKHSTRCSISSVALNRLKKDDGNLTREIYYLDLLAYKMLSNKIVELFKTPHESPQILLIKNGICVYTESHMGIQLDEILEKAN